MARGGLVHQGLTKHTKNMASSNSNFMSNWNAVKNIDSVILNSLSMYFILIFMLLFKEG